MRQAHSQSTMWLTAAEEDGDEDDDDGGGGNDCKNFLTASGGELGCKEKG